MSPRTLFRGVAVAEAVTWAGLLAGMFVKYVPETSELGVTIFGPLHGIAFIAFCLGIVAVGVDQQWRPRRILLGLLSAIPPFATLAFEWWVERHRAPEDSWRLAAAEPDGSAERALAWLVRKPAQGLAAGVAAVVVLTAAALLAGPPVG